MQILTATDLRTKTSELINSLLKGEDFTLIHRSRVVGKITPKKAVIKKPINGKIFANTLKSLEPKQKMTYKQLMKHYDQYMIHRHGSRIS